MIGLVKLTTKSGPTHYLLQLPTRQVAFVPLSTQERERFRLLLIHGFPLDDQYATFRNLLYDAILKATPDFTQDDLKAHIPDDILPAVWNVFWSISQSFSVVDGSTRCKV